MVGTIRTFRLIHQLVALCSIVQIHVVRATPTNTTATCSAGAAASRNLLTRPPHEMPRAVWQDRIPPYQQGPLTPEQVETYYRDGVLVLPEFYGPTQIDAVRRDTQTSIGQLADRLFRAGRISSPHRDLDWTERLFRIAREDPHAPIFLAKAGVLPLALWDLYTDPRMLDVAAQLGLRQDIALNPAWSLRAKMQKDDVTVVPWHQDNSYWEPRVWDELIITVWVALVPASRANGCMEFVRGGHRSGKTARHVLGRKPTWYTELNASEVSRELLDGEPLDVLTCEVPTGTAILFPGTTPHRSLDSTEASVRWSTDFRLHHRKAARPGKTDLDWFYGLKDSIVVRENNHPDSKIDWEQWAGLDRTKVQDENVGLAAQDFDPVIVGPWMDLWDVEQHPDGLHNPHVERYLETLQDGDEELIQSYKKRNNW